MNQFEKIRTVGIGEFVVAGHGQRLKTLLGSCVAVVLYDPEQQVGGMAHILLPESDGKQVHHGKHVDTAIPALIECTQSLSSSQLKLTAKVMGGASMFPGKKETQIGSQNVEACLKILAATNIPVIGQHCGGNRGRKVLFDTSDGRVMVELVGQGSIIL
jgi:chemotaxis protein CheD